ncbi:MAG: SNF2 helicase associated domain-containing protein [Lachnospiraceae bacterium]|nr:SNF2 helicase associated domain-containing protein [Lachnospiraceae bacterium]
MELRDLFRAFNEDEIARGAELYFAGEFENIEIKDVSKGKNAPGIGIRACWKERRYGRNNSVSIAPVECGITLDREMMLPRACDCSCEEFERSGYGCAHMAGLLCAYMVHTEGAEVFSGTRLETLLKNIANVDDPFMPGVLRRTDDRLLSILEEGGDAELPVWNEEKAALKENELLGCECSVCFLPDRRAGLELKIGYGRKYIVKRIADLLKAYRDGESYTLGKEEIMISPAILDTFTEKLLDKLVAFLNLREKLRAVNPFGTADIRPERFMYFSGRELDELMELLDGQVIGLNGMEETAVDLHRKGLKAVLKKKAYGASLQMAPMEVLEAEGSKIYIHDGKGLFCPDADTESGMREIRMLLGWSEGLYIREADIGRVLEKLMPVFERCGELVTKGLEAENYEKEKADFEFRLDYSKEGLLSCEAFSLYPRQELRFHLFDDSTGRAVRDGKGETEAARLLTELFDRMDRESFILYSYLSESALFEFLRSRLPELEKLGTVLSTDAIKRSRVRRLPTVKTGIRMDNGSLFLSVSAGSLSDDEMAGILGAYRKKKRYYRLKSGEFVALETEEAEAWDALSELYDGYGISEPGVIKLPLYRALYLQEALSKRQEVVFDAAEDYIELISSMEPERMAELEPPRSLKKILRPYQTEGFRWISMLKRCGLGGILADDMGLGKTLQVLSFLLAEKNAGKKGDELRTLVVCPASLVYNWKKEIETYTDKLKAAVIAGTAAERTEMIKKARKAEIWITSYDLLKRDIQLYEGIHFANEIIDEAQYIKNRNTQASQSVRLVDSAFRLALTGTPIENHLGELWSIMDYLMPGFLYDYSSFQKDYEIPVVLNSDEKARERLRRMVHPFILRRMKRQVLKELPEKLEETVTVSMESAQRKLYDANVQRLKNELEGVSQSDFNSGKLQFLAQLTALRQICCDPSLLYEDYDGGSAKLEACIELVRQSIEGGHKLLLFSQFTSMLDLICGRLKKEGIEYHRIDGSVSKEKRMFMVDSFANDDVPVFCISLKAGGTGLNLTAADIVIHYDPWWNQAAQDQATDRTHRIGQTRTVNVYELIVQDTVEEKIQQIKESKSRLADDILSGGEISSAGFDKEEMLRLLG